MEQKQKPWTQDMQPVPSTVLASGEKTDEESRTVIRDAPRQFHGATARFEMIKTSVGARKAAATAGLASEGRIKIVSAQGGMDPGTYIIGDTATTLLASLTPDLQKSNGCRKQSVGIESPRSESEIFCLEEKDHGMLLGPMGSFHELPKVSSAADLIRTSSHDQSFHSVSQMRGVRQANIPTQYSDLVQTGYYRPSDLIARLYTSTAASLTSASAKSVAKASTAVAVAVGAPAGCGSSGAIFGGARSWARDGFGTTKVVTAPFAVASRETLHNLALGPALLRVTSTSSPELRVLPVERSGDQSPSPPPIRANTHSFSGLCLETSESRGPGNERGRSSHNFRLPKQERRAVINSAQETRTHRRDIRSPPRDKRIVEVASPKCGTTETRNTIKDFLSWNPPSLFPDEMEYGRVAGNCYGHHGDDVGGIIGREKPRGEDCARLSNTSTGESERQKKSIERYWTMVKDKIANGSPNTLGAGARSPLFELQPVRI